LIGLVGIDLDDGVAAVLVFDPLGLNLCGVEAGLVLGVDPQFDALFFASEAGEEAVLVALLFAFGVGADIEIALFDVGFDPVGAVVATVLFAFGARGVVLGAVLGQADLDGVVGPVVLAYTLVVVIVACQGLPRECEGASSQQR
jgi:hypothetical protein